jgi:ribosomal protein L12E/L44/L45/RPP1/RPP2
VPLLKKDKRNGKAVVMKDAAVAPCNARTRSGYSGRDFDDDDDEEEEEEEEEKEEEEEDEED